eukprot:TRINITY_DN7196_c0_g2_i1.p1 TRINITY_DN7196_c0_g2~~TRINITY_DN7196_c0_g2_i1.p1  ORF type:complete len:346 (-),score=65.74 TRINITY_DN7196_c0_g2_i1:98-1135(-)
MADPIPGASPWKPLAGNDTLAWTVPFGSYTLAGLYGALFIVAVVCIIVISVRDRKFTAQKMFYVLTAVFGFMRTFYYGILPSDPDLDVRVYLVLWSIPADILFSTYSMLVFFWADAYYQSSFGATVTEFYRRRRIFVLGMCNLLLYAGQCGMFAIMIYDPQGFYTAQPYYLSSVALISVIAFAVYGGLLMWVLHRSPVQSSFRQKKVRKILAVLCIVATSFVARAAVNFSWPYLINTDLLPTHFYWVFALPFYFCVEILPTFLVLVVVTKLPPRRSRTHANIPTAWFVKTRIDDKHTSYQSVGLDGTTQAVPQESARMSIDSSGHVRGNINESSEEDGSSDSELA